MRIATSTALVLGMLGVFGVQAYADGAVKHFDIAALPAPAGLNEFAQQADVTLVFSYELVSQLRTNEVHGEYRVTDALTQLVQGTQLSWQQLGENTIAIGASTRAATQQTGTPLAEGQAPAAAVAPSETQKKSFWGRFRVAEAAEQSNGADSARSSGDSDQPVALEEIVVSAQKRVERLQDVPVPVSAISATNLANSNLLQLQSYYTEVPGLNLALSGDTDTPLISIRGITAGGLTNPTVGVVIDEVSYGGTVLIAAPQAPPEIDPSDLQRVEVLRGPQGTLYGASSMGGLLKYVTIDPSPQAFSAKVQAGVIAVDHGDVGHTLRGAVNVPLSDTLAVRASGFTTREPGYIDNVLTAQQDVNRRKSDGGRLSMLWAPTEQFTLKLSALLQDSERLGGSDVDTALGSGLQNSAVANTGTYKRETQAYSATLMGTLGAADLVSATGYSIDHIFQRADETQLLGGGLSAVAQSLYGVPGVILPEGRRIHKFTQEIRATFPLTDRLSWLVGGFYTDEDGKGDANGGFYAADPLVGEPVGLIYFNDSPNSFKETAAFTNITFQVSDQFDIQAGGRYSENKQTLAAIRRGFFSQILFGSDPSIVDELHATDDAFTYLLTPRFKLTPNMMLYARMASGYRPGGINIGCPAVACTFGSDTTRNYELGLKGDVLDGALSIDSSVYYIDWRDVQITVLENGFSPTANASRAKSQGIELSVQAQPLTGMSLRAWVAYDDAKLTEDFPVSSSAVGHSGDRLPYSARFSGSLAIDQTFPIQPRLQGFVGASVSYVGDRMGIFQPTPVRENFPSYTQVDIRGGVQYDTWTLSGYVTNLTDKRGVLRGGLDNPVGVPTLFSYTQPRTSGISVTKTF